MDFEKWMVVSVDRSGARADVSNIWKTAPSVLNKIGNMCGQTVSSRYFGYFFNNNHTHTKKCRNCCGFFYLYFRRKN